MAYEIFDKNGRVLSWVLIFTPSFSDGGSKFTRVPAFDYDKHSHRADLVYYYDNKFISTFVNGDFYYWPVIVHSKASDDDKALSRLAISLNGTIEGYVNSGNGNFPSIYVAQLPVRFLERDVMQKFANELGNNYVVLDEDKIPGWKSLDTNPKNFNQVLAIDNEILMDEHFVITEQTLQKAGDVGSAFIASIKDLYASLQDWSSREDLIDKMRSQISLTNCLPLHEHDGNFVINNDEAIAQGRIDLYDNDVYPDAKYVYKKVNEVLKNHENLSQMDNEMGSVDDLLKLRK